MDNTDIGSVILIAVLAITLVLILMYDVPGGKHQTLVRGISLMMIAVGSVLLYSWHYRPEEPGNDTYVNIDIHNHNDSNRRSTVKDSAQER